LLSGLLDALNRALDDQELFQGDRFPDAIIDDATRVLLDDRPLPEDLERLLNRWLLEASFPEALAQTRHVITDWTARFDLLESSGDDRHFVVEMTDDRRAVLRFGDDDMGRRPEAATRFRASYRVGNGKKG